ncbi:MAG: nucleotidyltransferase family protein [Thermomicrobiales bacterium]|nr:nucleotidyltransferase family protein [Thermomicrobiales bacterium]
MLLQQLYYQCWRPDAPPLDVTLEQLVPLLEGLLHGGGAGLVWPRIRHRAEEYGAVGEMLEHTYQQCIANQQTIERDIATAVTELRAAGIEPVLVKGWSISSRYPAPAVRRPGDIDLIVPDGTFAQAQRIINQIYGSGLHTSVDLYDDTNWRSKPSPDFRQRLDYRHCGDVKLATLNASDALRQVSLHYMRHLRNRVPNTTPYWLCDIGVLVETLEEIDWTRLLAGDPVVADRIRLALALSRDIVGTDASRLPMEFGHIRLPKWAISDRLQIYGSIPMTN